MTQTEQVIKDALIQQRNLTIRMQADKVITHQEANKRMREITKKILEIEDKEFIEQAKKWREERNTRGEQLEMF